MPNRFMRPPFNSYVGKTDPVEHVSHYIHMMSLHIHNDTLMCKVFPIESWIHDIKMVQWVTKGFNSQFHRVDSGDCAQFVTCSRVPQPVDALLSIKMGLVRPFAVMPVGIGALQ